MTGGPAVPPHRGDFDDLLSTLPGEHQGRLMQVRKYPSRGPVHVRCRGHLLLEGTREINSLIVGRALTGQSAFV
jgi:hypothetical protein